jgi:DNA-binding GntR family transcriptional regulator
MKSGNAVEAHPSGRPVSAPASAPPKPAGEALKKERAFLYQTVTEELRVRIRSGMYAPGQPIPTEAELVRQFDVSAITIRRAVRELMTEGLVFGRQGLGVFVADTRRIVRTFTAVFTTSMSEDMSRGGYVPSAKERSLVLVPASQELAAQLRIEVGARIYRHEKTIFADNEPIGLDTTFLPGHVGDVVRHTLTDEFIVRLLARHGITVDHMDYSFEGGVLSPDAADALGLPTGFPVLSVKYTAFDHRGECLFTGRTVSRSDRVSYDFCGRPDAHRTNDAGG